MSVDVNKLKQEYPLLQEITDYQPVFWKNPNAGKPADLPFGSANIFDVEARLRRYAPYFAKAFPETAATHGIIESPLRPLPKMKQAMETRNGKQIAGQLYLKADNELPISGSIKSRGGIYEVLKFAEQVAIKEGGLVYLDDYAQLTEPKFHDIFAKYGIAVGSTGNLGLSIGIVAAQLGFRTTVYMSADATQWKKDLLRQHGVTVVEFQDNFTHAITEGRKDAAKDPMTYFIDDEGSSDLFLGYSDSSLRIQKQIKDQHIPLDDDHPIFVYLPAGVGGSPGGTTFGLKTILGKNVHAIFAEPTHIPAVLVGMLTGLNEKISVYDVGMDGKTAADGLAVGRPSRLALPVMKTLLDGIATFDDEQIFAYLTMLADTQKIYVEPSAAAGFTAIDRTIEAYKDQYPMENATHIVWATGGSMVPQADMDEYYAHGKRLLDSEKK
ncbi:D-serine dehydratase [Lactobacillus selangorensis]|uniref:Probable D-serine dehydratase n=1 Tax=Lactobacillus selangorensis TaxID=81857 RepID=A0A0R2FMP3_9LACO|nr:D-serine ammonia-lyase [Lactobacillus selangorensis]KRN28998.1 D-serine dehydratase [Lactobacillus selangorensis]KRN32592.1 D-serine dehydratase [Lactobacillus selangorensis]